eukprot:350589-Chlamydomonas_euryale.AAC.1
MGCLHDGQPACCLCCPQLGGVHAAMSRVALPPPPLPPRCARHVGAMIETTASRADIRGCGAAAPAAARAALCVLRNAL